MSDVPSGSDEVTRARTCGLALLEASSAYETATVGANQAGNAVVLGLVARARRLMRASYVLADADLDLEASAMRRTLEEYVLTIFWLLSAPGNLKLWWWEDARQRLLGDQETRDAGGAGSLSDDARQSFQKLKDQFAAELLADGVSLRMPTIQERAKAFPYAYAAYRLESNIGTHPSRQAAEEMFTVEPDGTFQLRSAPAPALDGRAHSAYGMAAYSLLTLFSMVENAFPISMVDRVKLDAIRVDLDSLAAELASRR